MGELMRRSNRTTPAEQQAVGLAGKEAIGEIAKRNFDVFEDVGSYMIRRTKETSDNELYRYLAIHTEAMMQLLDQELRQLTIIEIQRIQDIVQNWPDSRNG